MLHVLGIDEDLKGAPDSCLHHIVDGDVDGVIGFRPTQLVGHAGQNLLALPRWRIGLQPAWNGCADQHGTRNRVRTIGRTALKTKIIGVLINSLESLEGIVLGDVDGF